MGVLPLYFIFLFLPTVLLLFLSIYKKRQGKALNKKTILFGILFQILWFILVLLYALRGIGNMMSTMG